MADTPEPASSATPDDPKVISKGIPRGVILGKDGKPCRSCTSFASWAHQTKAAISRPADSIAGSAATAAIASTVTASNALQPLNDCPADVETLGRGTWTLLHTIAAQYPTQPSAGQQADVTGFVDLLSRLYPCWVCAEDFHTYVARSPVRAASRDELGRWLCAAHNEVNEKLGKPVFDCNRWEERWRTGWKDGRCD